jgi:hypothetical protein
MDKLKKFNNTKLKEFFNSRYIRKIINLAFNICYIYLMTWLNPPFPGVSNYLCQEDNLDKLKSKIKEFEDLILDKYKYCREECKESGFHDTKEKSEKDYKSMKYHGEEYKEECKESQPHDANAKEKYEKEQKSMKCKKYEECVPEKCDDIIVEHGPIHVEHGGNVPHEQCYNKIKKTIYNDLIKQYGSNTQVIFDTSDDCRQYSLRIDGYGKCDPKEDEFCESEIYVNTVNKRFYVMSKNGFKSFPLRMGSVVEIEKKKII